MNPLIYAFKAPRTNAEARAFQKLTDISEVAQFCSDLTYYDNKDFLYALVCRGIDIPEALAKKASEHCALVKKLEHHMVSELIGLIDEYNEILAEIKADTRPRDQILESEGYNFKTGKWEQS